MSDFKELEKMFVKIVVNEDARPFQWIYAVDDAWRWPNRMQLEVSGKACRPVFTDYICGKTIAVGKEKITPQKATPKRQAGADTPQLQNTTQAQDNSLKRLTQCFGQEDNNSDADTAEALIHFIQERFSNSNKKENYGLCFCSFEYFHSKIEEIDRPQNAVFFDLRHQLASTGTYKEGKKELTSLREEWREKLKGYSLFGYETFNIERLGWYLHYGLKFGKVGTEKTQNRSNIHFNNILIISSAVANTSPDPDERDALGEYLQTQNVIWQHVKDETDVEYLPGHFNFAPLPKNFTNGHFEAGLKIFNNSFKRAGNWISVQKAIYQDLCMIWENKCSHISKAGHVDPEHEENVIINTLNWAQWLYASPEDKFKGDFEAVYREAPISRHDPGTKLSLPAFVSILSRCAVPSLVKAANEFTAAEPNQFVELPTKPGILFLFGLIDFSNLLQPDGRTGRTPPKIELKIEGNKFNIIFSFPDVYLYGEGIRGLKSKYEECPNTEGNTATAALRYLGKERNSIHKLSITAADGSNQFGKLKHCPNGDEDCNLSDTLTGKTQGEQDTSNNTACDAYLQWITENNPNSLVVSLPVTVNEIQAPVL